VRILARPGDAPASLAADDVTFERVSAPVAETTPAPTAVATPTASATPAAAAPPDATPSLASTPNVSTPGAAVTPTTPQPLPASDQAIEGGRTDLLRITEVVPDPVAAGNDAGSEWVELTNLSDAEVWLTGFDLEDAAGRTEIEGHIASDATLVIAGPDALVGGASNVLRVERIGNGLRNDGDQLRLVDAEGRAIDEVLWGDANGAELRPGPGESIERLFDLDGTLLSEWVSNTPTPGAPTETAAAEGEEAGTTGAATGPTATQQTSAPAAPATAQASRELTTSGGETNFALWLVLFAVAALALGAVGGFRIRDFSRDRDERER
jgi:hypothetical protein